MTMSKMKYLETKELEYGVILLTLNREDKLNALNEEVLDELGEFFRLLDPKKTRGVIFTGAGEKSFIAGADIAGMSEMDEEAGCAFSDKGQKVSLYIEESPVPVIAAVNGFALGGGLEMALSCDFILASKNAFLGLPEVSLGLIPGFGGTQRLTRIVGRNRAKELIYTGKKITADEAKTMGLVLDVVETKEALIEASLAIFKQISRNSPFAVSQAKAVINAGADLTIDSGLEEEKKVFSEIFNSYDMKEGTKAFTEKRRPEFKGE